MKKIVALFMCVLLCMTAFVGCAGYGEQTYETELFNVTAGGKWEKMEFEDADLTLEYTEFFGDDECYIAFITAPAEGYGLADHVEWLEYTISLQPSYSVRKSEAATVAGRSGHEITGTATDGSYSCRFSYMMFIENDIRFIVYIVIASDKYSEMKSEINDIINTLTIK